MNTITALSPQLSDVAAAIDRAVDGDIVVAPNGWAAWNKTLTINKGITLKGSPRTVIVDEVPRTQPNQGGVVISASVSDVQHFRLSQFVFWPGVSTNSFKEGTATIRLSGNSKAIRVDNCQLRGLYSNLGIELFGNLLGVIDHNTIDMKGNGSSVSVTHANWGGKQNSWGSWAEPSYWGSEKFIFIEDNIINNSNPNAVSSGTIDSSRGGRWVARHNLFNNLVLSYHGSDSGMTELWYRGTRAVECYNNEFVTRARMSLFQNRSGPLLFHGNKLTGQFTGGFALKIYRLFMGDPTRLFGVANGHNPWDLNATEADGSHVDGHPPFQFLNGVHTGVSSLGLSVAGANWQPGQWVGYSVTNIVTGFASYVVANTFNTMTFEQGNGPTVLKFNPGEGFVVYKVLAALDQPCRGCGDLLIGNPPQVPPTPARWLNQEIDPSYSWDNKLNGIDLPFSQHEESSPLREGRDYFNIPKPDYTPYVYPHPLTLS